MALDDQPAQPPLPGCLRVPSDGWPGDSVEDPALDTATKTLREREPPSTQCLIARVMTKIIHDQVWPGSTLPFGGPTRALRIAERAASAVLRSAADEVPGVTTVSCRLARSDLFTGVRVSMTLTAEMNRPLPETVGLVRRSVADTCGHVLGMVVTAVDITVIEVHHASV
ncbi:Asp23/Gls24 family envelope stress response protein [Streptomyces sp. NPDC090032]|uniref:Asp23/Gls24 family envelope stress response protein n=1 Tax=unclassified Streptomyces TaxID=2593676 RepID=UPI0037174D47